VAKRRSMRVKVEAALELDESNGPLDERIRRWEAIADYDDQEYSALAQTRLEKLYKERDEQARQAGADALSRADTFFRQKKYDAALEILTRWPPKATRVEDRAQAEKLRLAVIDEAQQTGQAMLEKAKGLEAKGDLAGALAAYEELAGLEYNVLAQPAAEDVKRVRDALNQQRRERTWASAHAFKRALETAAQALEASKPAEAKQILLQAKEAAAGLPWERSVTLLADAAEQGRDALVKLASQRLEGREKDGLEVEGLPGFYHQIKDGKLYFRMEKNAPLGGKGLDSCEDALIALAGLKGPPVVQKEQLAHFQHDPAAPLLAGWLILRGKTEALQPVWDQYLTPENASPHKAQLEELFIAQTLQGVAAGEWLFALSLENAKDLAKRADWDALSVAVDDLRTAPLRDTQAFKDPKNHLALRAMDAWARHQGKPPVGEDGKQPLLPGREALREALKERREERLGKTHDPATRALRMLKSKLNASAAEVEGDQMSLTYRMEDPRELTDFEMLGDLKPELADGALIFKGRAMAPGPWFHRGRWLPPFRLEMTFECESAASLRMAQREVGAASTLPHTGVQIQSMFRLTPYTRTGSSEKEMTWRKPVDVAKTSPSTIVMACDGKTWSVTYNGVEIERWAEPQPGNFQTHNAWGVWARADMKIQELKFTGSPHPEWALETIRK
jgi:hypothetical protein